MFSPALSPEDDLPLCSIWFFAVGLWLVLLMHSNSRHAYLILTEMVGYFLLLFLGVIFPFF